MTRNTAMKRLSITFVGRPQKTRDHYRRNYPFYVAAEGDLKALKRVIRNGFDPKELVEDWGWTVLGLAARYGHLKMVEYLLSLGIEGLVDHRHVGPCDWGWREGGLATPLHLACEMYRHSVHHRLGRMPWRKVEDLHFRIAKLLIENGADVHDRDVTGNTPYSRAFGAYYRNDRIVRLLEDHGCGEGGLIHGSVESCLVNQLDNEPFFEDVQRTVEKFLPERKIDNEVVKRAILLRRHTHGVSLRFTTDAIPLQRRRLVELPTGA